MGPGPEGGSPTDGINLRRGTDASIHNSIIAYWNAYGIQVQGAATLARGLGCDGNCADPGVFCGPAVATGDVTAPIANVALRAYPNPVKSHATFAITLDADTHVELGVYDVSGRLVDAVADQEFTAGAARDHLGRARRVDDRRVLLPDDGRSRAGVRSPLPHAVA